MSVAVVALLAALPRRRARRSCSSPWTPRRRAATPTVQCTTRAPASRAPSQSRRTVSSVPARCSSSTSAPSIAPSPTTPFCSSIVSTAVVDGLEDRPQPFVAVWSSVPPVTAAVRGIAGEQLLGEHDREGQGRRRAPRARRRRDGGRRRRRPSSARSATPWSATVSAEREAARTLVVRRPTPRGSSPRRAGSGTARACSRRDRARSAATSGRVVVSPYVDQLGVEHLGEALTVAAGIAHDRADERHALDVDDRLRDERRAPVRPSRGSSSCTWLAHSSTRPGGRRPGG